MASLERLMAAGFVAVVLLASAKCDIQSFKQHMEAEKRTRLMLDPTAVYGKENFYKVKPVYIPDAYFFNLAGQLVHVVIMHAGHCCIYTVWQVSLVK